MNKLYRVTKKSVVNGKEINSVMGLFNHEKDAYNYLSTFVDYYMHRENYAVNIFEY